MSPETFEHVWPELASTVSDRLARRGVPSWLRDDIVQETGLRLFKMWAEVDAGRSPRALALTIANNLLWDERCKRAAREVVGSVPDRPHEQDVENAGIARFELWRVRRALEQLSPAHRSVLLAEVGDAQDPAGSPDAVKMLRLRARRRMRTILEGASAGSFLLPFRRVLWRITDSTKRSSVAFQLPAAVAVVAGALTLVGPGSPFVMDAAGRGLSESTSDGFVGSGGLGSISRGDWGNIGRPGSSLPDTQQVARETRTGDRIAHVEVGHEGDPVTGAVSVYMTPTDEDSIDPPTCTTSDSANEVKVSCSGQVGDQEIRAEAQVRIDP